MSRHILQAAPVQLPELEASVARSLDLLRERKLPCPKSNAHDVVADALSRLQARGLIAEGEDGIAITGVGQDILTFYANSIAHHFDAVAANEADISAVAE